MASYLEDDEDCVLLIKTTQFAPFRTLMVALKDIIQETNIIFKKDGMYIASFREGGSILVNLFLEGDKFEKYVCKKEKIIVGVTVANLFKLINTVNSDDIMSIYISDKDYQNGIIDFLSLKFENENIKQCVIQKLKIIETNEQEINIPHVEYSYIISMVSTDFQRIIKNLNGLAENVEIKSVNEQLIFTSHGDFSISEFICSENDELEIVQQNGDIIQGIFNLSVLNKFVKCTNLCNHIELYLSNDMPLVVKYNVASLGIIELGLSPKAETIMDE